MAENPAISVGLKLNDLAKFDVGPGVVLLTLKDAGKNAQKLTYADLYETIQRRLARTARAVQDRRSGPDRRGAAQAPAGLSVCLHALGALRLRDHWRGAETWATRW